MRFSYVLLAVAGCATTTSRHPQYDAMLSELRRDADVQPDRRVEGVVGSATLDRRTLIDAVLAANRDLEAMRHAWRASVAMVPAASGWEDPMVNYSFAPLSIAGSDAPYGQRIELKQKLPFPGKRAAATDAAVAEAEVMHGDLEAARLAMAELASQLFDDAYVNARATEVNLHHKALLAQMRKVADARVASGRGSLQDALQADVELAQLEREQLMLDTERLVITARINGLLHRDPAAPLPPPPAELPIAAAPAAIDALQRAAQDGRPQKRVAEAKLAGAQATVTGAERAYYPDIELMASYDSMWDMPEHRWMLGVGIEIPIQRGKRAADLAAARARVAQARAVIESSADEIRVDVVRSHRELVEGLAVATLYEARLLPAAHAQVDAALAGFTTGQNDFPVVIQAERSLREIELAALRARADTWRRAAALDRSVGRTGGTP